VQSQFLATLHLEGKASQQLIGPLKVDRCE